MEDNILDSDFREEKSRSIQYVGFWTRVLAAIVDVIVIIPIIVLVTLNLIYLKSLAADLLLALIMLVYKPWFEYKYGATFGKMALKIRVLNEQFEDIDLQTSLIRNFLWMAPGFVSMYHSFLIFSSDGFPAVDSFWTYGSLVEDVPDPTGNLLGWLTIIAVIFVGFTQKKQGLHDMMAKTVCVYGEEK